jgi:hypothetical protein
MEMSFWRKIFEDGHCPSSGPGLFAAPYLEFPELSLISNVKPIEKNIDFAPRTGTKCQLHSQVKGIVSRDWKGLQMVSFDRFEV